MRVFRVVWLVHSTLATYLDDFVPVQVDACGGLGWYALFTDPQNGALALEFRFVCVLGPIIPGRQPTRSAQD